MVGLPLESSRWAALIAVIIFGPLSKTRSGKQTSVDCTFLPWSCEPRRDQRMNTEIMEMVLDCESAEVPRAGSHHD
ncbi:hypothetical protein QBC35DRAFT_491826 [Podospora australis]|uniref:Uncharacterized protein n=1 Tax=Podospora australis TaxID=1536484 RepID=A0AAN6X1I1_9PEZI|nr:hypothetical protein QBC35DRAFT_491826 [Podospora australis]